MKGAAKKTAVVDDDDQWGMAGFEMVWGTGRSRQQVIGRHEKRDAATATGALKTRRQQRSDGQEDTDNGGKTIDGNRNFGNGKERRKQGDSGEGYGSHGEGRQR